MKSTLFAIALIMTAGVSAQASTLKVVADQSFTGTMASGDLVTLTIQPDGSVLKGLPPTMAEEKLVIKTVEDARMGDGDLVITFEDGEKLEQSSRGVTGAGSTGVYFIDSNQEQINLIPSVTIQAH